MFKVVKKEIEIAGKKISLETGKNSKTGRWCNYSSVWRNSCFSNSSWG